MLACLGGAVAVRLLGRSATAAGWMAFALFLVGFGIKMGMWPFWQVWLPDAHPAAPSPVTGHGWSGLSAGDSQSLYAPLIVAAVVWLMFAFARRLARLGRAQRRVAAPWLCGYACGADMHRYRPSGFYGELTRLLDRLGIARRQTEPVRVAAVTEKKEPCAWSLETN